ncbi:MAG: hypothetical protein QXJ98_04380, partial [Archaeoglobaceae archaeon]
SNVKIYNKNKKKKYKKKIKNKRNIVITKKINKKWINIIKNLKNFIESFSGDIVEQSLKWLYGDMVRLTDFID